MQIVDDYIKRLEPHVRKLFREEISGHDISHLTRVKNTALFLSSMEGGDDLVVGISAFLHDVHRIMQNESGKFVSPSDSLPNVRKILKNVDLSEELTRKICYAIEHHEEYGWNGSNVADIDTLILQDADNLDAIGAIGISRTFSYMAVHGMPMYDETVPLGDMGAYTENDVVVSASTIHHIYHKLLKLGDNMNTETAKKLARKRVRYMRAFAKEFLNEWNASGDA